MPVKKTTHHAGHTTKHVGTTKHSKTSKHSPGKTHKKATAHKTAVHTKAKHPAHAKATGLALVPGDVACCAAEALAASLRLQGVPVRDRDVLDLFRLAGGDDDAGVPIRDALAAASEYGLGGVRLAEFEPSLTCLQLEGFLLHPLPLGEDVQQQRRVTEQAGEAPRAYQFSRKGPGEGPVIGALGSAPRTVDPLLVHPVILDVDLPGPHAVLATPDGWWSWGELWCPCEFPDAVVEEAWAVTWAVAA